MYESSFVIQTPNVNILKTSEQEDLNLSYEECKFIN